MDQGDGGATRRLIRLNPKLYSEKALKTLEFLRKHIKGQDNALLDIIDALEIRNADFRSNDKTIFCGLFLGGSGVGKTLVAQILALLLFGDRRAFTYINCELYSASHEGSRLFGAPPGYVGHNETPILAQEKIDRFDTIPNESAKNTTAMIQDVTKKLQSLENSIFLRLNEKHLGSPSDKSIVDNPHIDETIVAFLNKRNQLLNKLEALNQKASESNVEDPWSIILFDEVEKAHPIIHTALLGMIDNAEIPMANGKITKFNNSIVIMTSNAGSGAISKITSSEEGMGFHFKSGQDEDLDKSQKIYNEAMKSAVKIFPTEYLGRLDSVCVFRPLSRETLMEIFDVEILKIEEDYLARDGIHLKLSEEVKRFIVDESTDKQEYGARLLKHKISKKLMRSLARFKNRGRLRRGDTVHVAFGADGKTIEFYKEPSPTIEPLKDPSSTT